MSKIVIGALSFGVGYLMGVTTKAFKEVKQFHQTRHFDEEFDDRDTVLIVHDNPVVDPQIGIKITREVFRGLGYIFTKTADGLDHKPKKD